MLSCEGIHDLLQLLPTDLFHLLVALVREVLGAVSIELLLQEHAHLLEALYLCAQFTSAHAQGLAFPLRLPEVVSYLG
jgi:hypothetical protein